MGENNAAWGHWFAVVALFVAAAAASVLARRPAVAEFADLYFLPPPAEAGPIMTGPARSAAPSPTLLKAPTAAKLTVPPSVVDSAMSREQALGENRFPMAVLAKMAVVDVTYLGFDGREHQGQIVVHRDLADDVRSIFRELKAARYPVEKVVPIVRYGWDDDQSVVDNNTSGFNYRTVVTSRGATSRLSRHANGRAIDLNPYLNPYRGGRVWSEYDPSVPGTLTRRSAAVRIFLAHGWQWGGDWPVKDYQHFEKP